MLPEKLSNDLCSLKPNTDKLTFSVLFDVNIKAEIKNIINIGNNGTANQTDDCASTILERFNDPTQSKTVIITKPIDTS